MTSVIIKGGNLNTDMHTGRTPCEDESRDQGDSSISQGIPKIASKPSEARGQAWNRFFFTALRRKNPCQHLELGLLASRSVRQQTSFC